MVVRLIYLIPFFISVTLSLWVATYCFKKRSETGALAYALIAFSQAIWTFGYIFELSGNSLANKIFWDNFQYLGGIGWCIGFFMFTMQYVDKRLRHPGLVYGFLLCPNIFIVLMAFIRPLHPMIRPQAWVIPNEPFSALLYDFSPLIWGYSVFCYGIFFYCIILLFGRFLRSSLIYRNQVGIILIGNLVPVIGTVLTLAGVIKGPYRDVTPFTLAAGNLIVVWGLFRYRIFDIVPLAWDKVIVNMSDAVFVFDFQHRLVKLNPAARSIIGAGDLSVIGKTDEKIFNHFPGILEKYNEAKETLAEVESYLVVDERHMEMRIKTLHGHRNRLKGRVVIIRDLTDQKKVEAELRKHRDHLEDMVNERTEELVTANMLLKKQIAEREQLEEQLRQSQKMEAIGRLAGGIAHDFNNLLVPISMYAEMSCNELVPESRAYRNITQIKKAANCASDLVKNILTFSRQQVLEKEFLDLNEVILKFKNTFQGIIGENIRLEVCLYPSPCGVQADKSQIDQVLMNLVVNAKDAMPDGGKLFIETTHASFSIEDAEKSGAKVSPGNYIILEVKDTGHGMEAETKKRIFDPFFTTKERDKGTGLGLSIIFGIVKQHQGHIEVFSEPGKGARFKIYLPRAVELYQPLLKDSSVPSPIEKGTETVMVVEDDETVRYIVCEALGNSGYQIIEAETPLRGLELASQISEIDLLLTDVVLPEMDGKALYEKVLDFHPEIRVIYMSGYSGDIIEKNGFLGEGVDFLQKPFTIIGLLDLIKKKLG